MQAKRSLAWVSETDSILIKGKHERFLKRQTGCLKRFDGVKLSRRKYISISEVISLSYTRFDFENNIYLLQKLATLTRQSTLLGISIQH
jgi:hypothetical protein